MSHYCATCGANLAHTVGCTACGRLTKSRRAEQLRAELAALRPLTEAAARYRAAVARVKDYNHQAAPPGEWATAIIERKDAERALKAIALEAGGGEGEPGG